MGKRALRWGTGLGLAAAVTVIAAACGGGPTATPVPPAATRPPQPTATAVPATATSASAATATAIATRAPVATSAPAPTATGPQPKYGGIVNKRALNLATLDPYDANGGFSTDRTADVLSNLIVFDMDDVTKIVPDLARAWEVSPDGKTITFSLLPGVKWHDGKPFTAADVVYTLDRGRLGEGRINFNKRRLAAVDTVQKVDDLTVRVTLKRPSAGFLDGMATIYMLMMPAHVPDVTQWVNQPIGTGPFKWKTATKDVGYEVERNPDYYKKDNAGRPMPYLDGVRGFYIPSPANALAAFRAGRLDCGCGYDQDFITVNKATLEREIPGIKVWVAMSNAFSLEFNVKHPPFDNKLVREAISASVDRREVAALVRGGLAAFPPNNLLGPEHGGRWGIPPAEITTYPGFRDPAVDKAHAANLFKQAGVDPRSLNIFQPVTMFYTEYGEALETQLSKMGAKVKLTILASGPYNETVTARGDFDVNLSTGNGSLLDPNDVFLDWIISTGTRNPGRVFDFPEVNRLAEEQDLTLDPVKRTEVVRDIQRYLIKESLFVPTVYEASAWAHAPSLKNGAAPKSCCGPHLRLERLWKE